MADKAKQTRVDQGVSKEAQGNLKGLKAPSYEKVNLTTSTGLEKVSRPKNG